MPQVNQIQNLLLAQVPPNVRAQALAGEDAMQRAAAPSAPYSSRTAGLLKALEGGIGGMLEGSATRQAMDGRQSAAAGAYGWLNALQPTPGASTTAGAQQGGGALSMPSAMPMGQGGIGSDHVASKSHQDFIASIMPDAQRVGAQLNVDPRIIAAQAAIESNYGRSAPGNNLFGIKGAGTGPLSTMESVNGKMVSTKASFAAYDSPSASFDGYQKLISGPRYAGVRNAQGLDAQLSALGKSGYATDPNYAAKVGAIARGIQVPGAGQGATVAAADKPAPGAQPVASDTLPPGITPDMVSAPPAPASDGSVRGDLMAAAAQHGMNPDAPAPNAQPVSMAGLPPGVTPAMFAASQGPGADLHRFDEVPTGSPPFVPGAGPQGPSQPPAAAPSPTAGAALADALSTWKPDLGKTQAAIVPDPAPASAPDPAPAPSILPPPLPPSGLGAAGAPVVPAPMPAGAPDPASTPASDGSLRGDLVAAASAHGMDVAGSPVVPPPQGNLTAPPPAPMPDPIAAGQMAGQDVAMDPVVPDPQGSMAAPDPSSPNGALAGPQSDAAMGNGVDPSSLRGTIMAAMGSDPGSAAPALPDTVPMPPPGAQTPQVAADAAAAAAAPLDPEGTGPANYAAGPGPSLRDTIAAAMGGPAGAPQPPVAAPGPAPSAPPTAPVNVDQSAGPAPVAALGATPDAQPAPSGVPVEPGSAPLPTFAQAGMPGPTPMPPAPGTGAALPASGPMPPSGGQTAGSGSSLPQSGPMPPPGAQSMALAKALSPDAPTPNAVQAGPAPVPQGSALANALDSYGAPKQPLGLPGDGGGDPSSAQNFMRQQALARQLGGPAGGSAPAPSGGMTPPPAAPSGPAPGGFMAGIGSFLGGGGSAPAPGQGGAAPAIAPAPSGMGGSAGPAPAVQQGTPDQARAIAQQTQANPSASPASQAVAGQVMEATGGQGGPAAALAASPGGLTPEQRQAGMALLTGPNSYYLDPEVRSAVAARLFPQMKVEKLDNGDLYQIDPTGTSAPRLLAHGGKFDATKNGVIYNQGTGLGVDGQPIGGANSYRPMTPAELKSYGIMDGRPSYIGPGGEPHFGMPEAQGQGETEEAKKSGEAAAARKNDMLTGAMAAPEKVARLKLLGTVLDNTQTGPLAPEVGNAAAIAQRLGISNDRLSALGIDPNSPVNNAIANKLAGEMTMSSIGAKNGGMPASNFSVAERQFIEALYPNIENQAGGNRAVTDVLTAVEQRKMQVADAWAAYKDQQSAAGKPLSYENFEDSFRRAHSQDNIFAPIIQKYQAGGYTPTAPTPGGMPGATSTGQGQVAPSMLQQPAPAPSAQGQGVGNSGGYLPGAARGAPPPQQGGGQAPRNVAPGVTGGPSQLQAGQGGDPLSQARAAIAAGAPRAAVMQRLQGMGINAAGL